MSVFQPGRTAVITGGASGIGLALAARCLVAGMHVLVADRDAATLAATPRHAAQLATQLTASSPTTPSAPRGTLTTHAMDVAKFADWAGLRAAVDADPHLGGAVHLLALNAGVGGASPWTDVAAFHRVLDVNLWGVVHGIATLLPAVQAAAAAAPHAPTAVVITGSKQGITNPPGTSPAYNASKAAVRALAEQLAFDLDSGSGSAAGSTTAPPQPSVHLLVPGWTFTGLSGNDPLRQHGDDAAQRPEKPAGAWWPSQVVDHLEAAMAAKRFYIICPDNDVSEAVDEKRILWSAGDITEGRPPLSRWRPEFKDAVDAWMKQ